MISTPLMRGETALVERAKSDDCISIHPPSCEGRPSCVSDVCDQLSISIHSPHARGDLQNQVAALQGMTFQSAPLMRGETLNIRDGASTRSFQSTPLMRGETQNQVAALQGMTFQSTPLTQGETRHDGLKQRHVLISIRSPHARGDCNRGDLLSFLLISIHSPHTMGDG